MRITLVVIFVLAVFTGLAHCQTKQYQVQSVKTLGRCCANFLAGLNSQGEVVGQMNTGAPGTLYNPHAVTWTKAAGTVDLGVTGSAQAVNDSGTVAGCYQQSPGVQHAFVWNQVQGIIDINPPDALESCALAINSAGIVVGQFDDLTGVTHPFVWNALSTAQDPLQCGTNAWFKGINDAGEIVGGGCGLSALLYSQEKGLQDLNALAGFPTTPLNNPIAISNAGVIITMGTRRTGAGKVVVPLGIDKVQ